MAFADYAPADKVPVKGKKKAKKGPPKKKGGNPFAKKAGGTGMEKVLTSHIKDHKFGKKKR